MADNVAITPGSGATIATDDVSGVQFQKVKLDGGGDGASSPITGDTTNGLDVDVTRVQGTVTISGTVTADTGTGYPSVATDGSAAPTTGIMQMGIDGSGNAQRILTTTGGELKAINMGWDAGTSSYVEVTVDPTLSDGESNSVAHLNVHSRTSVYNGSTWDRVRGDTTNGMDVDVTRVQGVVDIEGNVAHDSADSGNPDKIGMRARSTVITSVASDDRADAIGTLQGYVITYPYALPQSSLTGTASATGTADTSIIAAQGAGITVNVTTITVYNDSTTNTFVNIKDGTTTRLVIPAPAKGGAMVTLPSPLRITANTAFQFASGSAVTTMYVSAVGFAGI